MREEIHFKMRSPDPIWRCCKELKPRSSDPIWRGYKEQIPRYAPFLRQGERDDNVKNKSNSKDKATAKTKQQL
jgi:hypothetical protein